MIFFFSVERKIFHKTMAMKSEIFEKESERTRKELERIK